MANLDANSRKWDRRTLFLIAVIIISFNLRPAITSVGPLLGTIRDSLGLSNFSAGLITSLPLLSFAFISPFAPKLGRKAGNRNAILIGLLLLIAGILLRIVPSTFMLFFGTAIIGMGIALINVLLPAVIKEQYPNRVGRMTGIYSTSMSIFAAIGSGLSVPLASALGLGWQFSLMSWIVLAFIGVAIWLLATKETKQDASKDNNKYKNNSLNKRNNVNLWKSMLAWQVTLFMGCQSFVFYVTITWLPEILQSYNFSSSTAGWLLSYTQFIGLPLTFLAPIWAERASNQKGIGLIIGGSIIIGYSGLLVSNSTPLIIIFLTLIGLALGGSISLSLTLIGLRTDSSEQAGLLSGMAQSVGYLLAAAGPLLIGFLFDYTSEWTVPIIAIVTVAVILTINSYFAGRNIVITH